MVNDDEEKAARREQVDKLTTRLLQDVSRETGLKITTIRDLMEKGWIYQKEFQQPDKFVKLF